ncbi:MAG TPA: thioredoxin family protein [Planctomycetota bacterium]|nr:thioredoxin family protein [Planctomycetota bacterium]
MKPFATARLVLVSVILFLSLAGAAFPAELWTEDAKAAMAQAAKEKKDLLIDFTGSDWCGWCIKLDKEVFSQEAFSAEAAKNFVFLKLDFPRKKALPDEVKKQNAEWQARFQVSGYPTIILADAEGRPYAKTGYRPGGPEGYLKHLAELQGMRAKRDAALAKAGGLEGAERAKCLDEALSAVGVEMALASYGEQVAEIIKLDADGKAGLKAKYEGAQSLRKVEATLQGGKFDEAMALADEALKSSGNSGETAQGLLFLKGVALFQKGDKAGCGKVMEEALKAAPESRRAAQIRKIIEAVAKEAGK